ncbi:Protein of unknown function [Pyronema omphalodes CBS 100304]|uniref:Uncharacterized protein n=1 Tax=Pyronema omphalodes (strain CBS 100304) TaxID=1076935 RepID=U4L9J5_PYROM|nr:Protein of unknown function [Pyronema omphalodes CBS 100304]
MYYPKGTKLISILNGNFRYRSLVPTRARYQVSEASDLASELS